MNRLTLFGSIVLLCVALVCSMGRSGSTHVYTFENPIDALSVRLPESVAMHKTDESYDLDLAISGRTDSGWTAWQQLELEKEVDPMLRESSLVIFSDYVSKVRIRGSVEGYTLNPIRVSRAPVSYEVAANDWVGTPKILSRKQWKADDELLYSVGTVERSDVEDDTATNEPTTVPERVQRCRDAVANYPNEFKASNTVTHDASGRRFRWARQYSPLVKLLVVHHTALQVSGDEREPVERMRALYEYHARNRGWGDIGYHYVIDENGQIYEGKSGGDNVVGGHVYCGNIGSVGIALMGNFEVEQPAQKQVQSLQWLLQFLGQKYQIDLNTELQFHGETVLPILGHGDLVDTACPGYYITETLNTQIIKNVQSGNVDASVAFPLKTTGAAFVSRARITPSYVDRLEAIGSTSIRGRPGQEIALQVRYTALHRNRKRRNRIGNVVRSDPRIGLTQTFDGRSLPVRRELLLPVDLNQNQSTTVSLKMALPLGEGKYTLSVGPLTYLITVEGRPLRGTQVRIPQQYTPAHFASVQPTQSTSVRNPSIRIRLTTSGNSIGLRGNTRLTVQGRSYATTSLRLERQDQDCSAIIRGRRVRSAALTVAASDDILTVVEGDTSRAYRGSIECQIIDNQLVLINELPIEEYLKGLAEEPDSEPYEKQRAFAIAARSYAAHYMLSGYRKFPGKPYDGDDSPARFQKYGGLAFEKANAGWVEAVMSTEGQVLKKGTDIVRAAYYSSNAGRTRSPSDLGWPNFPNVEVFVSKADPWCEGLQPRGHGVGMSGCGSKGQALEGKSGEEILKYYYTGVEIGPIE